MTAAFPLTLIYGALVFIWSFVFLNRSYDRVSRSFLVFLSDIIVWMVLSASVNAADLSFFGLAAKTVYWLSMMNVSVLFLHFAYRLLNRPLDWLFYLMVGINTAMLAVRYLYPIDYSDPSFWRLSTPVIAPLMSFTFSLPALYAMVLVLRSYLRSTDRRLRIQLRYIFWGAGLGCALSVVSEYLLPVEFHISLHPVLLYFAFLIFVFALFISIMKYRLLNMQSDYIFRKLFLNAGDGIIILNANGRVISINSMAQEVLRARTLDSGDRITDVIPEYRFEENYQQHAFSVFENGQQRWLAATQYPLDTTDAASAKLLILTDITAMKQSQQREIDLLAEKSAVDQLTGLYSRQYLMDLVNREAAEGVSRQTALLFIDVDDFKNINDQYGHLIGDGVLQTTAGCIRSMIRSGTDAIRFGGDEFLVLLNGAHTVEALAVAGRIHQCVAEYDFSDYGVQERITLSIGIVSGTEPILDLVTRADMAMYQSKRQGKNRTTVFDDRISSDGYHMKI